MSIRLSFVTFVLGVTFCAASASAIHSRLADAKGECVFSPNFVRDYDAAQKQVDELKSAEPLIKLLARYKKSEEQAELLLSIGLAYNQRTGVVDPAKATVYLTRALEFSLPEQTYIEICMWRGGSYEQLKRYPQALRDYLRGLLACSYHDLSGGWPEIESQPVPKIPKAGQDSGETGPQREWDAEWRQSGRDYLRYREAIDLKRFLLQQRYYFVEAVRTIQADGSIDDKALKEVLGELSPDKSRYDLISGFLKSENKRPWP